MRKAAGEDMAIREVEKKHMKEIVLKLMRLSYIQNLDTIDDKKEIEYKQLIQQLTMQEQAVTLERMKELDFTNVWNFSSVYSYKADDYDEQQQLAQDVKNEYLSGKFDPKMAVEYERTAREMLRRGLLLN